MIEVQQTLIINDTVQFTASIDGVAFTGEDTWAPGYTDHLREHGTVVHPDRVVLARKCELDPAVSTDNYREWVHDPASAESVARYTQVFVATTDGLMDNLHITQAAERTWLGQILIDAATANDVSVIHIPEIEITTVEPIAD